MKIHSWSLWKHCFPLFESSLARNGRLLSLTTLAAVIVVGGVWLPCFAGETREEATVDIMVYRRPIAEVVKEVHDRTGISVILKNIDPGTPVSGTFQKTAVPAMFLALLKGHNVSVLVNEKKKNIVVSSLGQSVSSGKNGAASNEVNFAGAGGAAGIPACQQTNSCDSEGSTENEYNEDKKILMEQQAQEYAQAMKDPDTVDPLTGMSLSDLENLHKQQMEDSAPSSL